jgi:hypothetical protein
MVDLLLPLLGPPDPRDRRTRWTPLLLACAAVLVAWETAQSLAERLERACGTLEAIFPEIVPAGGGGGTYQGWAKALRRQGAGRDGLHLRVAGHLRELTRRVAGQRHWTRQGWCAFVVDGTKIDCPRTAKNQKALGRAGRAGSGPQLYLTVIYHVGTGLPWAWRVGRSTASERTHLRQMIKHLPAGALLIADAGFVGYDLWRTLRRRGLHILIRVGSNVRLLRKLGCAQREGRQTTYLWPSSARRRQSPPPLPLRLIQIKRPPGRRKGKSKGGRAASKSMWLMTDLPGGRRAGAAAGRVFTLRWGVEVFFRSFKQKLARRKMCSRTPQLARLELHWGIIALTLAQLTGVRAVIDAGHDPLSWSMAATLCVLRRSAARHDRTSASSPPALERRLANCRQDRYQRRRPKRARHWAHKKRDQPPGDPKIRLATPAQVLRAAEVYDEKIAA